MPALAYMCRAVNRAFQKGPADTLRYSFHVAKDVAMTAYIDLRYGGRISRDRLDINRNRPGYHALMHTDWKVLRAIFGEIDIKPDDVLVDVGCGDGRVINYWLSCGLKNLLIGIEIDEEIVASTAMRYARYPNVKIICGDATIRDVGGTIYYLYNPFLGTPLRTFSDLTKQAKIILYNYIDLTPFADRNIEYLKSTQDALQYRAAIITSRI